MLVSCMRLWLKKGPIVQGLGPSRRCSAAAAHRFRRVRCAVQVKLFSYYHPFIAQQAAHRIRPRPAVFESFVKPQFSCPRTGHGKVINSSIKSINSFPWPLEKCLHIADKSADFTQLTPGVTQNSGPVPAVRGGNTQYTTVLYAHK